MEEDNMVLKNKSLGLLGLILIGFFVASFPTDSVAQDETLQSPESTAFSHSFTKKHYTIGGEAKVLKTQTGTEIVFSDNFETRSGPDLKVYLSKLSISELEDTTVTPNSVKIGVLKSRQGTQSYVIPDDLSLENYKSVVIHCEAFSKLWGGFDL